ncbi:hypothetical protein CRENBAI_005571 [Crenichthys baileyi]|uniref:Uncharacterized protein n=1 Tax=Crenichthys baileyi TaxID=28760 RepID=A0AAV9SFH4_9TELE
MDLYEDIVAEEQQDRESSYSEDPEISSSSDSDKKYLGSKFGWSTIHHLLLNKNTFTTTSSSSKFTV